MLLDPNKRDVPICMKKGQKHRDFAILLSINRPKDFKSKQ
jgi:hypothetical protein